MVFCANYIASNGEKISLCFCFSCFNILFVCFNSGSSSEKCDFETDLCKAFHELDLQPGWIRRNGQSDVGPPYSDHNGNDSGKNPHRICKFFEGTMGSYK